ncbi:MAG: FHA domain-containing protein [Paracoccaceae bacterium]
MNFIKGLITKRSKNSDTVSIGDVAALIDDVEAEEPSNAEMFNNLAAIQSRIKGAQSPISVESLQDQKDTGSDELISDFADAVKNKKEPISDRSSPVALAAEQMPALSPVMTDEDFSQLDEELARMSDELVQQDDKETTSDSVEISAKDKPLVKAQAAKKPPQNSFPLRTGQENSTDGRVFGKFNDVRQNEQPKPSRILISELQGGASIDAVPATNKTEISGTQEAVAPEVKTPIETSSDAVEIAAFKETSAKPHIVEIPAPAAGRSRRRAGRVKTRLLGFERSQNSDKDPFEVKIDSTTSNQVNFPVGWIVVVEGLGLGTAFALFNGVSQIGRGDDQVIALDFGDSSISRNNHAAIAYDDEQHTFYLGHGGKANLVRLNNKPVLSTEEVNDGDVIRIGETTLRFVALCGDKFNWDAADKDEDSNAAIA